MATATPRPKLLTIVGPTASGKSELAMRVAKEFNCEIIAADSRTIYIGMDVGTAKPSAEDQRQVPHWGVDLVEPGQRFSAAQFKKYAEEKISDIQSRDRLPILVGGTGLYIDSVLFDFKFRSATKPQLRKRLESLAIDQLQELIQNLGYQMPENRQNKRHLIRVIEAQGQISRRSNKPLPDVLIIGLKPADELVKEKIGQRAEEMFNRLNSEIRYLLNKYGESALNKTGGIAYLVGLSYIKGEISTEQAKKLISTAEWQYARRQKTWFRRNKYIKWFSDGQQAYNFLKKRLNT